jgi:hypothetical protein
MDTGSRPSGGRSRRIYVLLGAFAAILAASFGPSVAPAAAAAAPKETDVMFVFDTSGSMSGELTEAKEKIVEVMEHTNASLPNAQYGVAEVRDYPFSEDTPLNEKEDEETYEKPWKLDQALTPNTAAVKAAIEPLFASGGGDGPESYGRALWETDTNPNIGWRAGARHEIVLIADNVPHDDNLDEGIPEADWSAEGKPAPWNTDYDGLEGHWELPGKWGIPGTVWNSSTNLDFQTIARQLGTDGKPLESVEFYGSETGYLPYWEYWAGLSGGVALNGTNGEFASKLESIVETGACSGACETPPHVTSTQVICNLVIATASDTCTATVGDGAAAGSTNPTGTVSFASTSGGGFPLGNVCTLVPTPMSPNVSSCSVQFLPPSAPSTLPAITATYSGDKTHAASGGSTHYGAASLLAGDITLSPDGTIGPGGTVEIPIDCGFPCEATGSLYTLPGLADIASVAEVVSSNQQATVAKHKKKKKKKPVLLGKGTTILSKPGKGKLLVKPSSKGKRALSHVGKKGVQLTLKFAISTLNGTVVVSKSEHIKLKPKPKKKKHH